MATASLKIVSAPANPAVTLADMKLHARVDSDITEEDTLLTALVDAARVRTEIITGRALISQQWDMFMDCFPSGNGVIILPKPPLVSVDSITYVDTNGASQTLATSVYKVDSHDTIPSRISLKLNQEWPETNGEAQDVTIRFTVGYGADESSIPETIKAAIKMMAAHWYENRESASTGIAVKEVPDSANALLWNERILNFDGSAY
jgi:uncharacterized phiE125 gp8 family phage protein